MPDLHEMAMAELASVKHTARTIDALFDSFFQPRAPEQDAELIAVTQRAVAQALKDPEQITSALADFGTDQWCRARDKKLVHACFDAFMAGDDAQFGVLLARLVRGEVVKDATDRARDELEEAREQRA